MGVRERAMVLATQAQRDAAAGVLSLAVSLLRRRLRRLDEDEISSLAGLAVCRAAATWDPAKARLTTWVGWQVRRIVSEYAGRRGRSVNATPLSALLDAGSLAEGHAAPELIELADPSAPEPAERSAGSEATARLLKLVKRLLPPREFAALWLRKAEGLRLRDVGLRLGVSKERVRQLCQRALERLSRSVVFRAAERRLA